MKVYFSRHNIFSRIRESENYFLINTLSGNADIVSPEKAREILDGTFTDAEEYVEKGYLIDEEKEEKLFRQKYLDFLDARERSEIQIFFVPNYSCNFSCPYCYQKEYQLNTDTLRFEVVDGFFDYIGEEFSDRKKYITIFGGEPLLDGKGAKEKIAYLIASAGSLNIDTAVVTNGFHLIEYIDILRQGAIREIQVTLDGTEEVHNRRRPLKGGAGTFNRIVEGIDAALENGFRLNLRVVLDAQNMENLPELAAFSIDKGWTENPLFKTQLGRNYELHTCQAESGRLYSRVSFYEKIYDMILGNPEVGQFHRPAYSLTGFLFDNGQLPDPLFDSCPACKTEWAFDYTGHIYPCTATVGKKDESLGTFYPEVMKNTDIIDLWEMRDITTIEECKTCNLSLVCGGGCGSVAKNKGSIASPDCRPEKELIGMGISLYFERGKL